MLTVGATIYLVVVALVLYLLLRRRASDAHARRVTGEDEGDGSTRVSPTDAGATRVAKRWILISGVVLPTVVLAPLFVASVRVLSGLVHDTGSDLTVHVTGH